MQVKTLGRLLGCAAVLTMHCGSSVRAQEGPVEVPGPHGGKAVYSSAKSKAAQDRWGYAGAYRAGDFVYLSGVVVGTWDGKKLTIEEYKDAVRRTFAHADRQLKAAGASLAEVVDIVSFHVWNTPYLDAGRIERLDAVAAVKREVMPEPHPAWTAVGSSGLIGEQGILEIRMIAYSPEE